MLVGGWRALRQYDLKLLLAYGTVSQLGFLVLVVGFGTRDAALAGVALLLAHALFKAALFLVVGIIDHAAGTRDWRKLSGLGRRMPRGRDDRGRRRRLDGRPAAAARLRREGGACSPPSSRRRSRASLGLGRPRRRVRRLGAHRRVHAPASSGARSSPDATASQPRRCTREGAPSRRARPSSRRRARVRVRDRVDRAAARRLRRHLPGPEEYHLALWHGLEPALAHLGRGVRPRRAARLGPPARCARLQAAVPPTVDSARGYLGIVSRRRPRSRRGVTTRDPAPRAARLPRDHRRRSSSAASARQPS